MTIKSYLVTTKKSPLGIIYSFNIESEVLTGIEIKDDHPIDTIVTIFQTAKFRFNELLSEVKKWPDAVVVEITANITFAMFWEQYDDASRSSKKRSEKIWTRLGKENQVKAYYYYPTYLKNKGNAEKKYCETYLNAEMWNN
jgi:hypothetical protein